MRSFFGMNGNQDEGLVSELFVKSPAPTIVADERGVIVMVNNAFSTLTGYTADELIGEKMSLFKTGDHDHAFYKAFWETLIQEGRYEGEIWNRRKDQVKQLLLEKIKRVHHIGRNYYIGMFEDVTESKKLVERYRYLAMHDGLTGLANRALSKDRFNHALPNTLRMGEQLGLLVIDLNEFKQVNDLYGHHIGDLFLKEIAKKLTKLVREGDTVSRFGGDEFLIIAERLKKKEQLDHLVQKIREEMNASIEIKGHVLKINLSIGCASFPQDGLSYENLLQIADMEMYEDKNVYYRYE